MSYSTMGPHVEPMGKSELYWARRARAAERAKNGIAMLFFGLGLAVPVIIFLMVTP